MKLPQKHVLLLIMVFSVFAANAQSEEKDLVLPKAVFKISPLHFFTSTLQFGTEVFNSRRSRSFNLDIGIRSNSNFYDDVRGITTEIGYRKYVKPMTLKQRKSRQFYQGIYYTFFVQGGYFTGDTDYYSPSSMPSNERDKVTIRSISPGFYMGLQKTLWEVVLMDIYVGGGIRIAEEEHSQAIPNKFYGDDGIVDPGFEGIYPRIGIKFGIGL
jgi:hypothetical protein